MLKIINLKKSFGGVQAVKNANFKIPAQKITALIGPNGAGKTTIFDMISGFSRPDSGKIIYQEKNLTKLEPYKIANLGIGRTFQQVRLFKNLTIKDHLIMTKNNEDTKILKNIFKRQKNDGAHQKTLDKFGIKKTLGTLVSDLSYGQRKLLQIALALEKPHQLLLLDEPVAGVNSVIQNEIENILLNLKKQGETMLLIDHDMNFVRKLADWVIALDAGQVIVEGTPQQVLSDQRILEAYLGQ